MKLSEITWQQFSNAYRSRKSTEHKEAVQAVADSLKLTGNWYVNIFSTTRNLLVLTSTKLMHTLEGEATNDFNQTDGEFVNIEHDMPSCYMRVEAFRDYGTINLDSVLISRLSGYPNPMRREVYTAEKRFNSFLVAAEKVAKPFCHQFVKSL